MGPLAIALGVAMLASGCDQDAGGGATGATASPSSEDVVLEAPEDDSSPLDGSAPQQRSAAREAGERVKIPAGSFTAGITPGEPGRDPVLEPPPFKVELGAFEIDRLPYPNDPRSPPRTNVDREEAAELCADRQGRLCTELEWERACRGPEGQSYAGSSAWDPSCATAPETCASGFGVLAMGAAMRELSASDVEPVKKLQPAAAIVRGARGDSAGVDHHCGQRSAVAVATQAADLGFRCCYGEPNDATIASPKWLHAFRKADLAPSKLEAMMRSIKRLAPLAQDVKYFREENAVATVKRRGEAARAVDGVPAGASSASGPTDPPGSGGFELANAKMTTSPLLWQPKPGEEILVVTGQSGQDSFVVAFHRWSGPEGTLRHRVGSAFVMKGETGPIVLAYHPGQRNLLRWLTCVDCYGESGNIRYRDENRVAITQY